MWVHVCTCVQRDQRLTSGVYSFYTLYFESWFFSLNSMLRLNCLAGELWGSLPDSAPPHPCTAATDVYENTQILFMHLKLCLCVSVWRYLHLYAVACGDQKTVS